MAGVKPRFVEWHQEGSPLQWVISREHGPSAPHFQPACRHRPGTAADAGKGSPREETEGARPSVKTYGRSPRTAKPGKIAARLTHTNSAYVQILKTIQQQAPELVDKVRSGILKVPDAARLARLSRTSGKAYCGSVTVMPSMPPNSVTLPSK